MYLKGGIVNKTVAHGAFGVDVEFDVPECSDHSLES
jgi:hypothetical protein